MSVFVFIVAIAIGAVFRVLWCKHFMEKKMYYVPPLLVTLIMAVSMYADPKSGAFILGVFIFDLVFWLIKNNKEAKEKYKHFLNKLMDNLKVEEIKNEN